MISEIRTCYLLHRLELGCAPRPEDILHVATVGGASVIGWPELGRIAVGHPADMFAVDASNFDWVGANRSNGCFSHAWMSKTCVVYYSCG